MESQTITIASFVDEGFPGPDNFKIVTSTVDPNSLQDGSILIKALSISADPYLRSIVRSKHALTGAPNTKKPGDPMEGYIAGKVLASKNPNWVEGDLFGGSLPFSTIQIVTAEQIKKTLLWKLTGLINEDKISYGIGILGMPGATAYGGLIDVLAPKEGQTIFISGAAGAVGGYVGQLAKKLYNCTVIGSCGGPSKCEFIKSKFGFDHAVDYKTTPNKESLVAALKVAAPNGIDMYFDNVGGYHFEAAFECLRPYGRMAICGGISEYSKGQPEGLLFNPLRMIYTQQRIEGFLSVTWLSGSKGNFLKDMGQWLNEGKFTIEETYFDGINNWPAAFQALFTGANTGKVVVRV